MAVEKIVIKVTSDTKGVDKTINKLQDLGKVDKENAKVFEQSAKKRDFLLQKNIKRLEKLRVERKKAFNPQDIKRFDERIVKTTKDINLLGGQVKKVDKASSGLGGTLGKLGAIVLGAFAVRAIVNFTEHLFEVALETEAFVKRAKKVFGESLDIVEEFAKGSAKSLGFTEAGFLGAAAAVGDILVPLGLSRERAAEMSVEAVKLGGALKEFTGDSRSAAEISNIVAKSLTGEVETLKTLGVVIDQTSQEFKDLVKSKQIDLGLTRQQAKAETIFQLAIDGSRDALESFETNTDSLVRQQSILTATLEEQTEHLGGFLTPAFLAVLKAANSLTKTTKDLAEEIIKENKAFEKQEKEVDTLVSRYGELTSQTELNKDEQIELRSVIEDLALRVPEAVTEFDRYGNALDINTEAVIANLEQQQNILRLRNVEVIKDIREEIEKFTIDVTENTRVLNKGFITTTTFSKTHKLLIKDVRLTASEIRGLRNENILLNADSAELLLTLEELGIELTDLEKEFIDVALGLNKFTKAGKGGEDIITEQIRNIFFLKNQIADLRKEQNGQGVSLARVAQITKEIIPLQKELNRLLGKEVGKEADEALQRRIDLLSLFQKEVVNTISLVEAQILQQQKLSEFTEEEEAAIRTGTEFRVAEFQKSLDGRRQALEIELQQEEIDQELFNIKIAQLDKEAADNKVAEAKRAADAIAAIANAGFNLLVVLEDRKIQLLDNETTVAIRNLQDQRDANLITEEEFTRKRTEIEKEADDKRRNLLRERAEAQKTAAIIEAVINTAVAITEALPNAQLAALVAILGAAEIAVITAQPIPEFHKGKKSELKDGEIFAKVLKSESVIPPEQSKKYKGAIDSMIDKNFEKYVFQEYMLPMIKGMAKPDSSPYDDILIWNNQKKQIGLMKESNALSRSLIKSMNQGNPWRSWS